MTSLTKPMASLRAITRSYVRWVFLAIVVGIIAAVLMSAIPYVLRSVADDIVAGSGGRLRERSVTQLITGSILLLTLIIGTQLCWSFRTAVLNRLSTKMTQRLRHQLLAKLLHLPMQRFVALQPGSMATQVTSDVDACLEMVQSSVIRPITACIQILCLIAVMLYINWRLAAMSVLLLVLTFGLAIFRDRKTVPLHRNSRDKKTRVASMLANTFANIRVVRAFGIERAELIRFTRAFNDLARTTLGITTRTQFFDGAFSTLRRSSTTLILLAGGILIAKQQATVGDLLAAQLFLGALFDPLQELFTASGTRVRARATLHRIFAVLDERDERHVTGAAPPPMLIREVRLQGVSFGYTPERLVLDQIHLAFRVGELTAIVGPNGAGKSTMIDLLLRFHEPTSGTVLINGADARRYSLHEYRRLFSVVEQDVTLFEGTLAENIGLGAKNATPDRIVESAKLANAHGFISELPRGYDTPVTALGGGLSGGQRQSIALARALVADRPVLLLDEATSNLDVEGENIVTQLIEKLQSKVVIVITHRVHILNAARQIVAISKGRVAQVGTYAKLIHEPGFFRTLFPAPLAVLSGPGATSTNVTPERELVST